MNLQYNSPDTDRTVPLSRKRLPHQRLLSLDELTREVKPTAITFTGIQDIPAEKIIGSENRSADFGEDFLPLFRRMNDRWLKVRDLLESGELTEPLDVFEYGGCYFVRDGNHRVSVAKARGIQVLSASVTLMQIPVRLCEGMNRQKIPLFKAKYEFHQATGIFSVLPEELFEVRLPKTWAKLHFHIFDGHREWYIAKHGHEPDNETLILDWNIELYENTLEEIKRNNLQELLPEMGLTDIFCTLMDFWLTHPGWLPDVYTAYIDHYKKRNIIFRLKYAFDHFLARLRRTAKEEENRFMNISRILFFRTDARIPPGDKHWYRFLTKQLTEDHYRYYHKKHGKEPKMDELTGNWYDELFYPACAEYDKLQLKIPFPEFYMGWMKVWKREVEKGVEPGFQGSLELYLKEKKPAKETGEKTNDPASGEGEKSK